MAAVMIEQAISSKRLKCMVPMNGFDIVRFGEVVGEDQKYAIATQNLNACHAVAIVSKKAAILGHFAPRSPGFPTDFPSGDQWIAHMVNRFLERVLENKELFEKQGSGGIVVVGVYNNSIALPEQVAILMTAIRTAIESKPHTVTYPVLGSLIHRSPNKGMVFIEGSGTGWLPVVWVEDRQVSLT
ncbi:MAG: hypothetical protein Q9208_001517 [Pyrenodesmia sp. 3 TL-2023]